MLFAVLIVNIFLKLWKGKKNCKIIRFTMHIALIIYLKFHLS